MAVPSLQRTVRVAPGPRPKRADPRAQKGPPTPPKPAAQKPVGLWDKSPKERESLTSQTKVQAATPFTGSQARHSAYQTPTHAGYGGSASDRTAQAWSRAAGMQQSASANQTLNDLDRAYQNKGQQVRAADVFNQRADQVRRFGLTEGQRSDTRSQNVNYNNQLANFRNQIQIARANADNNLMSNTLGLIAGGGLLNSLGTVATLQAAAPLSMGGGGMGFRAFGPVGRGLLG